MITLTKIAVEKIKEIADSEGIDHTSVRLKVLAGGCAGFSHDIELSNIRNELDEITEQDGITVIVDPLSYQFLENASVDYVESAFISGFKFNSPDIKKTCGCGNSVAY